jgi:hypothetical protein
MAENLLSLYRVVKARRAGFVGACNIAVGMCRKDERAKKSQALRITVRWEF